MNPDKMRVFNLLYPQTESVCILMRLRHGLYAASCTCTGRFENI